MLSQLLGMIRFEFLCRTFAVQEINIPLSSSNIKPGVMSAVDRIKPRSAEVAFVLEMMMVVVSRLVSVQTQAEKFVMLPLENMEAIATSNNS